MLRFTVAIVLFAAAAMPARAELYLYSITNPDLTGTLNGVAFTDAVVTMSAIGDTANIVTDPTTGDQTLTISQVTLDIAGFSPVTFTDPVTLEQFFRPGIQEGAVAFEATATSSLKYYAMEISTTNLDGYSLATIVTDVPGGVSQQPSVTFNTSGGLLEYTTNRLKAGTYNVQVVPEPSTFVLSAIGGLVVMCAVRNQSGQTTRAAGSKEPPEDRPERVFRRE